MYCERIGADHIICCDMTPTLSLLPSLVLLSFICLMILKLVGFLSNNTRGGVSMSNEGQAHN